MSAKLTAQDPSEVATPTPGGVGAKTSEFVAVLSVLIANIIGVLVVSGFVASRDASTLINAVQAIIGSAAVVGANVVAVWRYISSRERLKKLALEVQCLKLGLHLPDAGSEPKKEE